MIGVDDPAGVNVATVPLGCVLPVRGMIGSVPPTLPPIGLGTGYVEGLTSYICRLAEAHCVSPTNLLRYQAGTGIDILIRFAHG